VRSLLLRALSACVGLAVAFACTCVFAQQYPTRPVKLIVPFPPGAGTDVVARLVAQRLGEQLGANFIVENRAGAGGAIGAEAVAKSEPDGYTLLFVASPFTTVAATASKPAYDPVKHFAPVASIALGPLVWAVSPAFPARTMQELIALARTQPGKLTYGSAGPGSVNHLVLEMLRHRTAIEIVHVPYKGMGPALVDLIGGQISMLTTTVSGAMPYMKQEKLRVLAVTGTRRTKLLPNVPTMQEAGVQPFDVNNYWGIVAPAATAQDVIARLHAEVQRLLATSDFQERLGREGVEPMPGSSDSFGRFIRDDYAAWRGLIVAAKLTFDN
jgi:tripartite-type tricarboxylate transporter receptor subunit TctC